MYLEFNLSNTGTAPVPLLKQSCQNNGNSTCWDQAKDFFSFPGDEFNESTASVQNDS